jgi:hypothetical protein
VTAKGKILAAAIMVMFVTILAVTLARETRSVPFRSSARSSVDESRASRLPAFAHARGPRWSPALHPEPEEATAADAILDASSASRSIPAWLDGGRLGFDDLAARWQEERTDPEWSSNLKSYMYAMLEPEELDLDLVNLVDCRQSLCRIELNPAHMRALVRLRANTGGGQPRFAHKLVKGEGDGSAVMVVYTAREDLAERVFPPEHRAEVGRSQE